MLLIGLVILSLSRFALVAWQWDRVQASAIPASLFVQGLRADLILLGYFEVLPLLLAPLLAYRSFARVWRTVSIAWGTVVLIFILFMELSSPQFLMQYDVRPNRLFIEYLAYPKEVFATVWNGFRIAVVTGVGLTIGLGLLIFNLLRRASPGISMWPARKLLLVWPVLCLIVLMQIRSTTGHRPANPAFFALTGDAMVNSLIINSAWSVLDALNSLKKEAVSSDIYGAFPREQVFREVKSAPWLHGYAFSNPDIPTLHFQQAVIARNRRSGVLPNRRPEHNCLVPYRVQSHGREGKEKPADRPGSARKFHDR